jgi:hypothetical protein
MSVRVAREQQHLKKQHARCPHRRRTTKPGQDVLAKQELHPEEKEGAQKNGNSKCSLAEAKS